MMRAAATESGTGKNKLNVKGFCLPVILSLAAGLVVHFILYSNHLLTPDGIWSGDYSISGQWDATLGRWGIYFFDLLQGGINSYPLSSFLALLFFSVGGVMIADLFQITGAVKTTLIAATITCSPMAAITLTYSYRSTVYGLSFLLAVLAVYLTLKLENTLISIGAGILCTVLSLSILQSHFGTLLAAGAGYFIISFLRDPANLKAYRFRAVKLLITCAAGMLLYYVLTMVALRAWNVDASSYPFGFTHVITSLPTGTIEAYGSFSTFFLNSWVARNAYGEIYLYIAVAVVALAALVICLIQNIRRILSVLLVIALLLIFPVFCNVINLLEPGTYLDLLMASGMMVTVPLLAAIICSAGNAVWIEKADDTTRPIGKWSNILVSILLFALVWTYTLSNQTDSLVMRENKVQTTQLANRIWQELEHHPSYKNGETPLIIAGNPNDGNYPVISNLQYKTNSYTKWGLIWRGFDSSTYTWYGVFTQNLGVSYAVCPPEQFRDIAGAAQFRRMPLYPADGSVAMIDGVMVVKMAEVEDWLES